MSTIKKKMPIATPEEFEGQTLMRMRTENIKRIRLVDVTFTEPLTLIGGDNSNGKTTFLDSYAWCLGGKAMIQMDPIHHGKQKGSITCEFGDGEKVKLTVTRTISRVGDSEWTSDIELDIPGHVAPTRIHEFLSKLAGEMSFDPLAFDRLTEAERFDALQKFVSGFDFRANALKRDQVYKQRADVNRDQRREQSAADSILIALEPPCDRVDEDALQNELTEAGQKNVEIERRRGNREKAIETIAAARAVIAGTEDAIGVARRNAEAVRDDEIERIRRQCDETIATETERLRASARDALASANDLQAKLDAAGELPELIDAAVIGTRLTEARASNKRLDDWQAQHRRRKVHQSEADELSRKSADLTAEIDGLDAAKLKAIAEAQLPIEGIGFGDGYITLNGAPWTQAGTAERYDASTAIAMALNPKLKVILIRDGSNVGKAFRERIRERAKAKGYRVLMEVVEEGGGTHVVLEDGLVKKAATAA